MKFNHPVKRILLAAFCMAALLSSCKKDDGDVTETPNVGRPVTAGSSAYVTQLFSYNPAPGQLINTTGGNPDAAKNVLNGKQGLVTLGAYGGNLVLGFDHTVINRDNQDDFVIYNNAATGFAEPGVVWVMADDNRNGQPDDTWYELAGAAQNLPGYSRNYAITYARPAMATADVPWTDNRGNKGAVETNTYHQQAYYPDWITANTYTLTGTLLPSSNINDTNPTYITSNGFTFGYADSTPGGDKLDIANATDAHGNKVALKGIDFVKIQTGIAYNLGWLGELSTEVCGVADLSLVK
ncbi:cell surface protein [Mucilaginibacter sp. CSA2-8R]|uniref:cell surface protein n=1 Tax=Mucilaginibacter sp. CSA2-8R TaxID=3141542 RepID=UPI00315D3443